MPRWLCRFSALGLLFALAGGCGGTALTSSGSGPSKAAAETPRSFLEEGRAFENAGKFAEALGLYQKAAQRGDASARLAAAELLLLMGQDEAVRPFLEGDTSSQSHLLIARSLIGLGQRDEALALLESAPKTATVVQQLRREVLATSILVKQGRRKEAQERFVPWVQRVSQGKFEELSDVEQGQMWSLVGQGAYLLRYYEDANEAFNEAEGLGFSDLELLLFRGRLFLDNHDPAQASELLDEALALSPHRPEVLLFQAQFLLESTFSFDAADDLSRRVLAINPHSQKARAILAGSELRDLNIRAALAQIDQGLSRNAQDLPLLSLRAATHFLAEDPDAFEKTVEQIHQLSPGNTDVFRVVGEYAEWEHRYPDIERLMRRAARLDPEEGRVRALLGLTLVRAGSDAAGVVELNRSFELDPFNVRVFNTLDLYEKIIPRDYVSLTQGAFRYRFPQNEAELLERYVPALVERAHDEMAERYGFSLSYPIDIELYESRDQFAVRTSGLPRTPIQGVCFGRKLATVTPIASPGNLGMTLWHELAHVFHITLSNYRVPRWLTEGLAEWETAQRKVGWQRELDLNLFQSERRAALPDLAHMSEAFSRARYQEDIVTAYYASSKIMDWLIESRGTERTVDALVSLGKARLPQEVLPQVYGAEFAVLDAEFRTWLARDLERFDPQFVSETELTPSKEIEARVGDGQWTPAEKLALGLSLLREGNLKQSKKQLIELLKEAPLKKATPEKKNPNIPAQATFALARLHLAQEEKEEARRLLQQMLDANWDGYEIRMTLGRTLLALKKTENAESHLLFATRLDPEEAEPWGVLAALRHEREDAAGELEAAAQLAHLSEHDARAHRRYVELLLEQEHFIEATKAAELALWVDLAGVDTHRLAALALSRAGRSKEADFEWESALLCPANPRQKERLRASWTAELARLGRPGEARRVDERFVQGAQNTPER